MENEHGKSRGGTGLERSRVLDCPVVTHKRSRIFRKLRRQANSYDLELDYRAITNLGAIELYKILSEDNDKNVARNLVLFIFKQAIQGRNYVQIYKIFKYAYNEDF